MRSIYIDRRDAELDLVGGALLVRVGGQRVASLPLLAAERLVVRGTVRLGTGLLAELWRRDIGLLLLSGRRSEATARFAVRPHGDARIRLAQYAMQADERQRAGLAKALLGAKLSAQARLLGRALAERPDRLAVLRRAQGRVLEAGAAIEASGEARGNALLGHEGAAAAAFFEGYRSLFAPALGFEERNRRPPRDPVNACLSLAYTLLHHEAVRACHLAGLDPLLGVLHAPLPNRESLACDLVEPLRPHVEELVWRLFANGELRAEHFTADRGGCLLGKTGRERFYRAWDGRGPALGRLLRSMAASLVRELRRREGAT